MARVKKTAPPASRRTNAFRQMLLERRKVLQDEVAERIRAGREGRPDVGGDGLEDAAADVQGDISLSLVKMQAETLARIDQALSRVDLGQYGRCAECGDDIAERRLNALPFAVRCQSCEQVREDVLAPLQKRAQEQGNFWHFSSTAGS